MHVIIYSISSTRNLRSCLFVPFHSFVQFNPRFRKSFNHNQTQRPEYFIRIKVLRLHLIQIISLYCERNYCDGYTITALEITNIVSVIIRY